MKCPHCTIAIHESWDTCRMEGHGLSLRVWYRSQSCPSCKKLIVQWTDEHVKGTTGASPLNWKILIPRDAARDPVSSDVPPVIAGDYQEACRILPLSPKASAALSRRCLQAILRSHGYKAKQLWQEIDLLLGDTDTTKAIPTNLRQTVDAIRHFGNFSAHPTEDVNTLEIIDVEDHEAEWCLQILEDMFEHFYVRPADAKRRKEALDEKLKAVGKLPSK